MTGTRRVAPEAGGAGKFFLVMLFIVILLGFGVWALWKPVFQPLVGDALPQRQEATAQLEMPAHDPVLSLTIERDWVVQRGVFNDKLALIRSPDFTLTFEVRVWDAQSGPSRSHGLQDLVDEHGRDVTATSGAEPTAAADNHPLIEEVQPGVIAHSIFVHSDEGETLLVVLGPEGDVLERAVASFVVNGGPGVNDLTEFVPAIAEFLARAEVL